MHGMRRAADAGRPERHLPARAAPQGPHQGGVRCTRCHKHTSQCIAATACRGTPTSRATCSAARMTLCVVQPIVPHSEPSQTICMWNVESGSTGVWSIFTLTANSRLQPGNTMQAQSIFNVHTDIVEVSRVEAVARSKRFTCAGRPVAHAARQHFRVRRRRPQAHDVWRMLSHA